MSIVRVSIVAVAGLLLTALGVAPQMQALLTGDEYSFRVQPVDPIDPFRGAYVDLGYPDLRVAEPENEESWAGSLGSMPEGQKRGDVFIPLEKRGDVWVASGHVRVKPDKGPYLACTDVDWRIRCGIESWFLPQDKARALEREVAEGDATATVKIDSRGHAVLVDVS